VLSFLSFYLSSAYRLGKDKQELKIG